MFEKGDRNSEYEYRWLLRPWPLVSDEMNEKEKIGSILSTLSVSHGEGKFKIYIGMSAGVGKSFRMLQEAHNMCRNGVDVKIGYIETHNRKETQALIRWPSVH